MKSEMVNLVIDIGNTQIKTGYFRNGALISEQKFEQWDRCLEALRDQDFERIIVSTVKGSKKELDAVLPFPYIFFDQNLPLPIKNRYKSPLTLGLDRLAAVVGGMGFSGSGPLLTVDLGTCITYDFLNEFQEYLGGAISPGVNMRAKAMNQQTAKLPLVKMPAADISFVGTDTVTCLQSGIYFGVYEEMNGFIARYTSAYPELKVFICGGDANYFESLTKDHIFVIPNLVLYGLDRILMYNVDK
ncbi:MAG: type III pantothenate kinase [Cyclobacteriaceae bacterium]